MIHIGGKKNICPVCSLAANRLNISKPHCCLFFTQNKNLTRYALSCGYLEYRRDKNLSREHNTFHVKGTDIKGVRVWESFDNLKDARAFLAKP
jgi:hypothetical protein